MTITGKVRCEEMFPKLVDLERMQNKDDHLRAVEGEDPQLSSRQYGKELIDQMITEIKTLLK